MPFFVEKRVFGPGTLPQAPFFMEKRVFGPGTLPQAFFFDEKTVFWCWNVAAGAFSKQVFAFPRSTPHSWPALI